MKKMLLVGHTGSANRGCEAIVKSTACLLHRNDCFVSVATYDKCWDQALGVEEFDMLIPYRPARRSNPMYALAAILDKLTGNTRHRENFRQRLIMRAVDTTDVVMMVGGDTYCYGTPTELLHIHRYAIRCGVPTVLWACSIGEENLNPDILNDLQNYSLICAREPLTYQILLTHGISEERLLLTADPAFTLETKSVKLPSIFDKEDVVGLNISPIMVRERSHQAMMMDNLRRLIDHILRDTSMSIAFIPHVYTSKTTQDVGTMNRVLQECVPSEALERVALIEDTTLSCRGLKDIISHCRFMIAGRTHAAIAAYSSGVPTTVVGYSAKSIGIARDLFGPDYERYVIHHQMIQQPEELMQRFDWLRQNEQTIRENLQNMQPQLLQRIDEATRRIAQLINP